MCPFIPLGAWFSSSTSQGHRPLPPTTLIFMLGWGWEEEKLVFPLIFQTHALEGTLNILIHLYTISLGILSKKTYF